MDRERACITGHRGCGTSLATHVDIYMYIHDAWMPSISATATYPGVGSASRGPCAPTTQVSRPTLRRLAIGKMYAHPAWPSLGKRSRPPKVERPIACALSPHTCKFVCQACHCLVFALSDRIGHPSSYIVWTVFLVCPPLSPHMIKFELCQAGAVFGCSKANLKLNFLRDSCQQGHAGHGLWHLCLWGHHWLGMSQDAKTPS